MMRTSLHTVVLIAAAFGSACGKKDSSSPESPAPEGASTGGVVSGDQPDAPSGGGTAGGPIDGIPQSPPIVLPPPPEPPQPQPPAIPAPDSTAPVVSAGSDASTQASIALNGSATDDVGIASVTWTKISGPGNLSFGNASAAATTVTADADGIYLLRLTAADAAGNVTLDEMQLICDATPPALSAGSDGTTATSLTQNALVSDASTLTFAWSQISGPGTITFGSPSAEDTQVSADADGAYVIRLTATDAVGNVSTDDAQFTLDTTAPSVNAGVDGITSSVISQDATVVDATSISYSWTQVSGPGVVTFGNTAAEDTTVSPDTDGAYVLRLTATDAAGNSASDDVSITRDADAPNVGLSSSAPASTNSSPIAVTVSFSESVTGFVAGDVVIGNGTMSNFAGTGANYTFDVTPSGQGAVTVDVPGAVAQDAGGNNNASASQLTRTYDTVAPTPTLASAAADPTNASPFSVSVTFAESVSGFDAGDVVVGNGTLSNFAGSGASYSFDVTPTSDGAVTVDVASNAAQDAATNLSNAATQLSRQFDATAPTLVLSSLAPAATNSSPIAVTATFSEAVAGFASSDVAVANGTISNFSGSGTTYTFDVTPVGQGLVTIDVNAGVAADAAGNPNAAAAQLSRTYDNDAPGVVLSSAAAAITNGSPIPVTVTFDESVTGFTSGDVVVTNGALSNFAGSGAIYTFDVTPSAEGLVTVDVGAAVAQDAATNANEAAAQLARTFDSVAPSVVISSSASNPTATSPIPVTVTFDEAVSGFVVGDVTLTNGTASNFAGSGTTYSFDVTPSGQGVVSVDVLASVATDAAGNGNNAAAQLSRVYDTVGANVTLSSTAPSSTNVSPIPVSVTFDEPVSGFSAGDVVIGNGTLNNFTGSGASYSFEVAPSAQGAVTVDVGASVAVDGAGNGNSAAAQLVRTFDTMSPSVVLASTAPALTNASPIPVTVTFNESVTGFTSGDVVVGNGAVSNFAGSGASYSFDVTPSGQGAVTVDVGAAVAQDAATNPNTAAIQLVRTYDSVGPTVTLFSTAPNPTNGSPIPVTVTFDEAVTGFDGSDVTIGNGSLSNFAGSGASYSFDVTPSSQGAVTVDVAGGVVQDSATNGNSPAAQLSRTYDSVGPTVSISSTTPNPTNASPIPVTVTFNESVTGFVAGDVTVGNGTVSNFAGSGASYSFDVTPSAQGSVTVDVGSSVAVDAAGNANSAATQLARTYDSIAPAVTGVSSSHADGTFTVSEVIAVTVTFDTNVTVVGTPQITLETGTTDRTVNLTSGSGTNVLTFNYTVSAGDTSTDLDYLSNSALSLNGGTIRDDAGNNADLNLSNPGASGSLGASKAIAIDTTAPNVTNVSSNKSDGHYTVGEVIDVRVSFSENVDVVTTGGTPKITLETGSTDRDASYASGTGTSTLVFNYTVQATDTTSDLEYLSTSALALNGGTIKDAGTNSATLTLPSGGSGFSLGDNKNLIIDTTAPGVPTGLTYNRQSAQVALSWTSGGGESGFIVVRRVGAAVTYTPTIAVNSPVGAVGDGFHEVMYNGGSASYTDTGLTNGTTYHYAVFAYDTPFNWSSSATTSATPYPSLAKQVIHKRNESFPSANTTYSITINPKVDLTKSVLLFNYRFSGSRVDRFAVTGNLSEDATNTYVNFARVGSGTALTMDVTVIEFKDGVTVQRGAVTNTSSPVLSIDTNVTISSVDLSRSFPLISYRGPGGASSFNNPEAWTAKLTSSTNLNLKVGAAAIGGTTSAIEWQVVQIDGATVQSNDLDFLSTDTSVTASPTSYDSTDSMLFHTHRLTTSSTSSAVNQIRGRKTGATQLTFDRGASGSAGTISWYLVTFDNGSTVQSGDVTGWATTTSTPSITTVDTTRSVATCGFGYGAFACGRTTSTSSSPPTGMTLDLGAGPTSSSLSLTRAVTTSIDAVWNVIEFAQ